MATWVTDSLISKDGTRIGYRQLGDGPGLILLHGAMQSGQSFTRLAAALCDTFTVYVPDRRGRGLSGPFGDNYSMRAEVEDLEALLEKTGTHNIFALSSGALIALQAACSLPAIHKMALYEPPLEVNRASSPRNWVPQYEKDLANGDLAAAMVSVIQGTGDRELLTYLPRFILVPLFRLGLRTRTKQSEALQALIPTVSFDARLIAEMAGKLDSFRATRAKTLLLGGTTSATFLTTALDALNEVLPNVKRIEFPGIGHVAADNTGEPERVADELRCYFLN